MVYSRSQLRDRGEFIPTTLTLAYSLCALLLSRENHGALCLTCDGLYGLPRAAGIGFYVTPHWAENFEIVQKVLN